MWKEIEPKNNKPIVSRIIHCLLQMASTTFHGTIKSVFFGAAANDQQVTSWLVMLGAIFTIGQLMITLIRSRPAPYGRYTSKAPNYLTCNSTNASHSLSNSFSFFKAGCYINAKLAWIIQESPAFVVPSIFLSESWTDVNVTTKILVGLFILHYFQRYVFF